ncbi:MAG TPA: radical SAM protein [Acidobacteriota bacterium]|nr:radical SAM protein [Acidobacteriota bacterium]
MKVLAIVPVTGYTIAKSLDGTQKLLFSAGYITVIIPARDDKYTVCVSCQIGCPIGCHFCYTGDFVRNLTSQEIVDQVGACISIMGRKPQSIVYMGMGEPMSNFVAVEESIHTIHKLWEISYKHITVSTSGVMVDRLLGKKYNAALSLHSMDPVIRKSMIPASLPLPKLLSFADAYCAERKHGLMIEYALIRGKNDSDEDLLRILQHPWPKNINFNLIEYNDKGDFVKSDKMLAWKDAIRAKGYKCFIRHSRGADIDAACGMLDYGEQ